MASTMIEFAGHQHRLYLNEEPDHSLLGHNCSSCGSVLGDQKFRCEKSWHDNSRHRCFYQLHLYCGPLPVVIHKRVSGYDLSLNLLDYLIPSEDPDDCWCDMCEEQRPPTLCVYHSTDPLFTATVECLWPEIKLALEGGLGELELRTVRGHVWGKVVIQQRREESTEEDQQKSSQKDGTASNTAGDVKTTWTREEILELLSDDERKLIASIRKMQSDSRRIVDVGEAEASAAVYTEEALKQFKDHITSAVHTLVHFDGFTVLEFSRVGDGVIIPSHFIDLYRSLVYKHGDVSANSKLTPFAKAEFFNLLFQVIEGMRKTGVSKLDQKEVKW